METLEKDTVTYKLGRFNVTASITKPSQNCIDKFIDYWNKLFEKKMRERSVLLTPEE